MEDIKNENNWLDAMIGRQALPEEVREETTLQFCDKWKISKSTYYYQASEEENQRKIVKLALSNAKKYAPDVLDNLGLRGKNDNRAAELYLKFILQLAEKTDITSGGEKIYTWGNYGEGDKNIPPENVESTTSREQEEVEGGSSS